MPFGQTTTHWILSITNLNTQRFANVLAGLQVSHILSQYSYRIESISLGFYVIDQQKASHICEAGRNVILFSNIFINKNIKSVVCFHIQPPITMIHTLCWCIN